MRSGRRDQFTTNLVIAGVSPKHTQDLARHSDIKLTMGVDTKLRKDTQLAEAVEKLPPPPTCRTERSPEVGEPPDGDPDGPPGSRPQDLRSGKTETAGSNRTIWQLRLEASELGIRGYTKYAKPELERAIREARLVGTTGTDRHHEPVEGGEANSIVDDETLESPGRKSLSDMKKNAARHDLTGGVLEVPKVGLEPTRVLPHRILSPARLPFRHFGFYHHQRGRSYLIVQPCQGNCGRNP